MTRMRLADSIRFLSAVAAFATVALTSTALHAQVPVAANASALPEPPRELRAAWVSTVYNGNWPSRPGLPVAQQQKELIAIMDQAKSLKLNAVIFQVRPGADSMYDSKLEPWSEFLTGAQGVAPKPYYDPLAFAVAEAHKRGLQLHAWFNPYRAATRQSGSFAANHVTNTMPNTVKRLNKIMWLDPGSKQAQDQTLSVIMDVVRRYDVDGVQFDDYFYPYASEMDKNGFPDEDTWKLYETSGGKLNKDDWRRENVNTLMRRVYESIKQVKPRVYFGIAPFGIWRPGNPEGIVGMDPYQQLYADSRKWLNEGWLDYCSPQLYWDLSKEKQSYPKLLAWWVQQNTKQRHIWPGVSITGVGKSFPTDDILKRIDITRKQPGATGIIYFSMKPLMEDMGGLSTQLKQSAYAAPALVPTSPWLDKDAPAAPVATAGRDIATGGLAIQWNAPREPDAFLATVYARVGGTWRFDVVPVGTKGYNFPAASTLPDAVAIAFVDRTGNESVKASVPLAIGSNTGSINIPAPVTAPVLPGAVTR